MSITFKELLKGTPLSDVEIAHQQNMEQLLAKVNVLREKYGKPLFVSSGYRSKQKHLDIYRKKGTPDNKIPWGSAHLSGKGIDFSDPNGEFDAWCSQNQDLLEELGLWQENPSATLKWVHLDMLERPMRDRPGCLKRQFNP